MKLVMGLLGGALVGAGAALLFAPQTGRATRAMLRDKATSCGNDVQEFMESKSTHLRNKMQGFKHNARKMIENTGDLQSMAEDVKDRGQEILDRGQAMIDHGMDAVEKAKSCMDTAWSEETEATLA